MPSSMLGSGAAELSKAWAVLRVCQKHTETSNEGCQELYRDHNSCGEGLVRKLRTGHIILGLIAK